MIDEEGRIRGRWTVCRPVEPQDMGYLRHLLLHPSVSHRFRWRGQTPSVEEFSRRFGEGTLGQWLIEIAADRRPIGCFLLSEPDFVNSTAFFSVVGDPAAQNFGIVFDGAGAIIDSVFETWPFRYLYSDVAEESIVQFESVLDSIAESTGFRREAMYLSGRYQNVHHLSISASNWRERVRPLLVRSGVNATDATRSRL